jgi:hypothetical protein
MGIYVREGKGYGERYVFRRRSRHGRYYSNFAYAGCAKSIWGNAGDKLQEGIQFFHQHRVMIDGGKQSSGISVSKT